MIRNAIVCLLPAAVAAAISGACAAEELGRLFFTPQQRQDLDRRRASNAQEAMVSRDSTVTLNGFVTRSGGRTTTWINGVPHEDSYHSADPARLAIRPGESDPEITLKVGQTLDKARGETRDALAGGSIKVPAAKRRADKP